MICNSRLTVATQTVEGIPQALIMIRQVEADDEGTEIGEPEECAHLCRTKGDVNLIIRGLVTARATLPGVLPTPKAPPPETPEEEGVETE